MCKPVGVEFLLFLGVVAHLHLKFLLTKSHLTNSCPASACLYIYFQLDKPGRLPDTGIPVIQNGSKVNDMVWDPFDNQRILVGRSVKYHFTDDNT